MEVWPSSNAYRDVRNWMLHRLAETFDQGEAESVVRVLLEWFTGKTRANLLISEHRFNEADLNRLNDYTKRLLQNEPVQHITGEAYFFGRPFRVSNAVLIPRPETEELVKLCLDRLSGRCRVLDLGTGSACIAISIALELPSAELIAWDISEEALKVAKDNARRLGAQLHFEQQDMLHDLPDGRFDAIVSNPPYIPHSERNELHPRVSTHEPELALFVADNDPLCFFRSAALMAQKQLVPSGFLAFECHADYADQVALLCQQTFHKVELISDAQGKRRFVLAYMPK